MGGEGAEYRPEEGAEDEPSRAVHGTERTAWHRQKDAGEVVGLPASQAKVRIVGRYDRPKPDNTRRPNSPCVSDKPTLTSMNAGQRNVE
jgi:hypothetical protein